MYEKLSNFLFSKLKGYNKHATVNKYSHICHEQAFDLTRPYKMHP
jgi:hypothetical protein